jgi:hypothetical protein
LFFVSKVDEDSDPVLIQIDANRSADEDNSEYLSVRILLPEDEFGPIGRVLQTSFTILQVTMTNKDSGVYEVTASGLTPAAREALLDSFLSGSIAYQPRPHWSGVLMGSDGIRVEAISTEVSNEVAQSNSVLHGTIGDMNTKYETAVTYINVVVAPVVDQPELTNTQTIVQENKGESDFDADLDIAIGQRLGVEVDDMDGSQSLDGALQGFPTNAQDIFFSTTRENVETVIDIPNGTVTISGNVVDVLAVLDSLEIRLAHDDDENFLIEFSGTSTDTNGVDEVSDEFYLEHQVFVQAVADTPTLRVGATYKPLAAENATLSTYPVTIRLNDTDGSESYMGQQVNLTLSTPTDIATGAEPVVEFGTSTGLVITQTTGHVSRCSVLIVYL